MWEASTGAVASLPQKLHRRYSRASGVIGHVLESVIGIAESVIGMGRNLQSTAHHVRIVQTALSINKSELARILRVPPPHRLRVARRRRAHPRDHQSRLRRLLRLLAESRVSASDPLFPRFVRSADQPGDRSLLDLLAEETIDEMPAGDAIRKAKALGDAIPTRCARSARLGCGKPVSSEPDTERRKEILATNMALMEWPRRVDLASRFRTRGCSNALRPLETEIGGLRRNWTRSTCQPWSVRSSAGVADPLIGDLPDGGSTVPFPSIRSYPRRGWTFAALTGPQCQENIT